MKTVHFLTLSFILICFSIGCNPLKPPHKEVDTSITANTANDGPYTKTDEEGKLREKGFYKNGKLEGKKMLFFPNGKIRTEETYVNDIYQGTFKEYFETGKLMQEGRYDNNVMTGIWKTYYDTGELKEEVTFSDNNENGPFKKYYKSGKVKWEGTYKNGDNEEGEMKLYSEEGELIKKLDCEHGECTTVYVKKGYEDAKN